MFVYIYITYILHVALMPNVLDLLPLTSPIPCRVGCNGFLVFYVLPTYVITRSNIRRYHMKDEENTHKILENSWAYIYVMHDDVVYGFPFHISRISPVDFPHNGPLISCLNKQLTNKVWYRISGLILCLRTSNEGRRYFVTTTLIGWA